MKKSAKVLALLLVVSVLAAMAVGCSKVAGKTYVFDKVEISGEGFGMTMDQLSEQYKDMSIEFTKDGKVLVNGEVEGYYKQDGDKIYALESADAKIGENDKPVMTVSGGKLVMEKTFAGVTGKITFKKK